MKPKQVFVRAKDENDRWMSCDVLDLDDNSFRAFVLEILRDAGLVVGIVDEYVDGERIVLRPKSGIVREAD